jgi:hypothetical protein
MKTWFVMNDCFHVKLKMTLGRDGSRDLDFGIKHELCIFTRLVLMSGSVRLH